MRCPFCHQPIDRNNAWKGTADRFYCSEFCADSEPIIPSRQQSLKERLADTVPNCKVSSEPTAFLAARSPQKTARNRLTPFHRSDRLAMFQHSSQSRPPQAGEG
jgi:hypothetical protein